MNKKYLFTLSLLLTAIATSAQMTMHDLRCENLVNPLGIDNLYPHFSWKLTSPINGDQQTAYQLQIAIQTNPSINKPHRLNIDYCWGYSRNFFTQLMVFYAFVTKAQ